MKAIIQDHYGYPADALELRDVETPAAMDGEVLVRVHAASIHVGDVAAVDRPGPGGRY